MGSSARASGSWRHPPRHPRPGRGIGLPAGGWGIDAQIGQSLATLLADLIRLVVLVVGIYGAAYLRGLYVGSQLQRAESVGRTAVWAVEQLAPAMGWDGKAKLARAQGFARRLGARAGLRLDDDQWQPLLEAAVHALQRPLPGPPLQPGAPRPPLAAVAPRQR